jgi:hypothetical protein
MSDQECIDALVKALLGVANPRQRQHGPCWCDTAAGIYCFGQPQCEAASLAIKGAYDFSPLPPQSERDKGGGK